MFAGQGSQFYGMGRQLRAVHPVFDRTLRELDTMFADAGLPGMLDEMHRSDRGVTDPFDRFAHTHPAILMVELALLDMLLAEGIGPDHVLGTSLGEYAAAATAGVLDREHLTRAIVAQVKLTEELCPPGGMAAVLDDVSRFDPDSPEWSGLELAAVNYDRHFVVSGAPSALDRVQSRLRAEGVACQRLPVRFAFHSAEVDRVAEPYQSMMATIPLHAPTMPLVSCATGSVVDEVTPAHMWNTVRGPIRFADAVRLLERDHDELCYVDLGPSPTLATFATHNLRPGSGATTVAMIDPFAPAETALTRLREMFRTRSTASRRSGRTAVLFPGQGSQSVGMAGDLFSRFPDLVAEADDVLGYSVERLCTEDPRQELNRTEFTQPALFVANALHYRAWQSEHDTTPDFFAGHSLGEFNALWAAGAFDFGTGLRMVRRRGELMAAMADGAMAAVIGLDEDAVRKVLSEEPLTRIDVANVNSADQVVISGPRDVVVNAKEAFLAAGAQRYVPLRVSGAFHSRHMAPAAAEFERFLRGCELRPPAVPVIANVTGLPYPDDVRPMLVDQLVSPVRWEHGVRRLLAEGVTDFTEVGPGRVLTKLVTAIRGVQAPAERAATPATAPVARTPTPATVPARPVAATRSAQDTTTPGSAAFRAAYGLRHAYVCGSMSHGIASEELVVRAGRAGLLAFFGAGGLTVDRVAAAVDHLRSALGAHPFGIGVSPDPHTEDALVALCLDRGVRVIEASGYTRVTRALARYRASRLTRDDTGTVVPRHRILVKVTRPDVAEQFLRPVPDPLLRTLRDDGVVTDDEAELAATVPAVDDVCVVADCGGHTERGSHPVLLPAVQRLRDRLAPEVRVGAAGGLGTPEAVATAFFLGADFVLTGSVNLCTAEAGLSAVAKDLLERVTVADTDHVPTAGGFEAGEQAQVVRRGVFFPARARRLRELYLRHTSLDDLDAETAAVIQDRWFRRDFEAVWRETRAYFAERDLSQIERAERDPRHRMALVFRWYLAESRRLAVEGDEDRKTDFQIQCGPALGAFNQWVEKTELARWRDRHVDQIAERLMSAAAEQLGRGSVAFRPAGASA